MNECLISKFTFKEQQNLRKKACFWFRQRNNFQQSLDICWKLKALPVKKNKQTYTIISQNMNKCLISKFTFKQQQNLSKKACLWFRQRNNFQQSLDICCKLKALPVKKINNSCSDISYYITITPRKLSFQKYLVFRKCQTVHNSNFI